MKRLLIISLFCISLLYPCDNNGDGGINVLDIVLLANCILNTNCDIVLQTWWCGDINGDGSYNVLDLVTLSNCVLADNCGG